MVVIDDTLKQQAKELWLEGKKYREISDITGIKESTIKSLASRYWKKEKLQPKKKKVATKVAVAEDGKAPQGEELLPEEIETLANEELTNEQRLFCIYYSKSFNATSAYMKAYESSYRTAMVNGCRLLKNAKIKEEIMKLKQERYARSMLTKEDIFQKYLDIACMDMTDYLSFGQVPIKIKNGDEVMINTVGLKESSDVDGTLIQEVKQGRDGVSIKLPDRMKALQWLSDHMGWATEEQAERVKLLEVQRKKLEVETKEDEEIDDDGFLDAIKNADVGGWTDEEI